MARLSAPGGLLLTHGAGSDKDHPTLMAIEAALDLPVRRMNFPYRELGPRRPPDRAPKLVAAVREQAAAFCAAEGFPPERLVLGGRSMGGRMCSVAVAEGLPAAGLVLLSYPLHPPGRPASLRVEHFPAISVPVLFVSGDKDAFGSPEELRSHGAALAGPVRYEFLPGGHDLKRRDDEIVAFVRDWLHALP